ncbi:MAG: M28 family peptidase, partial [Pyrinomonadaceae bacterium]
MKRISVLFIFTAALLTVSAQNAAQNIQTKASTKAPTSHVINAEKLLRDVEVLAADDMQGRGIGTVGGAKAREYVVKRFKEVGLESFAGSYLQPFEFTFRNNEKANGVNVIGYIKGKKNKDQYIVVTAHYDHVGIQKNEIYNGADDDASGTSALFALAEYF